jgi:peptidyl-prolyl cis-trans isomerase B (cyclophilin B)
METIKIEIKMKKHGTMIAELYPEIAPITVENFVNLIKANFFDGLIFHRVIAGFMIQGGGFDVTGRHHEAKSIKGEFAANGIKNDLKHTPGVLSMARTMVNDSASSQFFIMHKTSPHLDGQYAAFGKVIEGMDVVNLIANVQTTFGDQPIDPVVIDTIRLI